MGWLASHHRAENGDRHRGGIGSPDAEPFCATEPVPVFRESCAVELTAAGTWVVRDSNPEAVSHRLLGHLLAASLMSPQIDIRRTDTLHWCFRTQPVAYRVMPQHPAEPVKAADVQLDVQLGRLRLANPIMVASGTFGYAREMAGLVDLSRLGGILPKTITQQPRPGNPPPRTVETAAGMLNSIGLDNDGIEAFLERQLPYLASLGTADHRQHRRQELRGVRADGGPARRRAAASPPWN